MKNCPSNYQSYQGVCVQKIQNCDKFKLKKVSNVGTVDGEVVKGEVYNEYTKNGEEVSVDPLGAIFIMR